MAITSCIHAGVDIGSTTTKLIVFNEDGETIYSSYKRHNADQVQSVIDALTDLSSRTGNVELKIALTGSGAKRIAEYIGVPFIQEVVANSTALKENFDYVRTAIELGGQDAKMIFFSQKREDGTMNVADMRMSGSCTGGTGAFIDEVASLLKVPIEEFNDLASQGTWVYDITDHYAKAHPLYERACRLPELVKDSDPLIHHTFDAGEGVLIPGEIIHHAKKGCCNFVILQPFGCLPNHVVGRGVTKRLKEMYPDAQILPLDYDPDVSFANIENRLQMLIMNMKAQKEEDEKKGA